MMLRFCTVAVLACGLAPHVFGQTTYWITTTVSDDVPRNVRTPFRLDSRERRPTAVPGPPIAADEADALGCQALANGWVICPPGAGRMRGQRVARPGSVAFQDPQSLPPADVSPPAQSPYSTVPSPPRKRLPPTPYAAPQSPPVVPYQAVPQTSPQATPVVPYQAVPQTSPQATRYEWSPDERDSIVIPRYQEVRPSRSTCEQGEWGGWKISTSSCVGGQEFVVPSGMVGTCSSGFGGGCR